jgi:hypothetical protein
MKSGNPENRPEFYTMVNDFHTNTLPEFKLMPERVQFVKNRADFIKNQDRI